MMQYFNSNHHFLNKSTALANSRNKTATINTMDIQNSNTVNVNSYRKMIET